MLENEFAVLKNNISKYRCMKEVAEDVLILILRKLMIYSNVLSY